MKLLITGICGFVGSTLARTLHDLDSGIEVIGIDNFIRSGSEFNRLELRRRGIDVRHADLRSYSDIEALPQTDYVIDAAANPSVLAGIDGRTSSRQLLEHNLCGTLNLLEYCKDARAGFIILSTSRVYSIAPLAQLPVTLNKTAFELDNRRPLPHGVTPAGISEFFSVQPPLSLYGSSKLASEIVSLEYGAAFGFPVWINRCGVLAGAGQFGRPDQGIFSFWINSYLRRMPLRYLGFEGTGAQVRDVLHPADIVPLLLKQIKASRSTALPQIVNVAGGPGRSMSLAQLSNWCANRFGPHQVFSDNTSRPFDIPWIILDTALAAKSWDWQPQKTMDAVLEEIAMHAEQHRDWVEISAS